MRGEWEKHNGILCLPSTTSSSISHLSIISTPFPTLPPLCFPFPSAFSFPLALPLLLLLSLSLSSLPPLLYHIISRHIISRLSPLSHLRCDLAWFEFILASNERNLSFFVNENFEFFSLRKEIEKERSRGSDGGNKN
jgi:hypothetical protein